MSPSKPTIADLARAAGVSASTASVVFSGKTPVTEATRRRVLEAAAALGYTGPDPRAASLRRGRSGIVGVVFEEPLRGAFADPVKTVMMDGLADAVAPEGAGLLLLRDDAANTGGPTLTTAPIDAAVLVGCSGTMRASLEAVQARGIPVVVIEGDAGPGVLRIGLDNREAQSRAAEHLRELGHRDVVALTLPLDARRVAGWTTADAEAAITVDVTRDRLNGVRDVFPDARAYAATGSSIDEGLEAGRAILADGSPSAIIAQSDLLAAGVVRAAEERGLQVPEDVSVTGFDGIVVDGLGHRVLTTLEQPAAQKGRAAGEAVAAMLAGRTPAPVELTCRFRRGDTTAPARRDRPDRDRSSAITGGARPVD